MNKPFKSENGEMNKLIDWVIGNFHSNKENIKTSGFLTIGNWQFRENGNDLELYHFEKGDWYLKDEWTNL